MRSPKDSIGLGRPFFSRTLQGGVLLLVCMLFIGVNGYVFLTRDRSVDQKPSDVTTDMNASQKAIYNGDQYLVNAVTSMNVPDRIMLDYIQRRFALSGNLGAEQTPIGFARTGSNYPAEVHFLERIVHPDELVKVPPRNTIDGVALTNIYSANCDHMALPGSFWPSMEAAVNKGGYELTHVLLALRLMKDNNCTLSASADILRDKAIQGSVVLAQQEDTIADLRYEAVAFLFMMERDDLVQPEWMSRMIREQRSDGGWAIKVTDNRSDPHATLLALWALLEYENPDKPYEPLIRRPQS